MKTIYLVRHGESEDNVVTENGGIFKGSEALLTEKGRKQARFIAERCGALDIDVVIASVYPRTRETAGIINERIKKPIEYSDVFVERRSPSDRPGNSKEEAEKIRRQIDANLHVPGFRYLDEETAEEIQERAGLALQYLEKRSEENILIVTHAIFLRALTARVLFGNAVTIRETAQCMRVMHVANTGLSILRYNPDDPFGPWRFVCWNDHAHLG